MGRRVRLYCSTLRWRRVMRSPATAAHVFRAMLLALALLPFFPAAASAAVGDMDVFPIPSACQSSLGTPTAGLDGNVWATCPGYLVKFSPQGTSSVVPAPRAEQWT